MGHEEFIAKKYAKAFLNLFIDDISLDAYNHIVVLEKFLKERREAITFLSLPHIKKSAKKELLDNVINRFKLPSPFKRLITILIESKRIFLLPLILHYMAIIYRQRKGILAFIVKSSAPLTAPAIKIVKEFLEGKTDKEILTIPGVDDSLIAGIRLESYEYLWEYSIAKKLRMLKRLPVE